MAGVALADRVKVNEGNREPRQPLVLLVDTSGSMSGDLPDVMEGLRALQGALLGDPVARNRVGQVNQTQVTSNQTPGESDPG